MEATVAYSIPLAEFLIESGYRVSVVNPAKIHAFAKSELSRAKTDKADAKLIARHCLPSYRFMEHSCQAEDHGGVCVANWRCSLARLNFSSAASQ
jgi:hypothetical protein